MRIFERGRLFKAVLVGLAVCLATVTAAEAGKRHNRHAQARAKAYRAAAGGDQLAGSPRYAAIVLDDKTGRVLYAKNAEALRHPASLTKMMTLYLLFEEMQKRKVSLNSRFTASSKASIQPPTKLGLRPGQSIAVEDAIRALVTKSANDVAVTVAENIGGTEEAFARRMTATARKLGMRGTTFYNASGLPNAAQFTTARDMVILGRALQERFPVQYRYFSTRSFSWGNSVSGNHNRLLYRLDGIDGIKTGYTNASGFNLVSSYRRDGRHLVAAVMGGSSAGARDDHMARLLATYLPQASAGAKVSSVFKENGLRRADAGDGSDDEIVAAAYESDDAASAPAIPAAPKVAAAAPAASREPILLMAATTPAPAAPVASPVPSNKPRIAASDIVPIAPPERTARTSSDHGAAVAMARAILLPDSGKPMKPSDVPVRTAAVAPIAYAPVVAASQPPRTASLAEATVSAREVAALSTGSLARRKAEEPAPVPTAKPAQAAGWLVQIGAYDTDKAARVVRHRPALRAGLARRLVGQIGKG